MSTASTPAVAHSLNNFDRKSKDKVQFHPHLPPLRSLITVAVLRIFGIYTHAQLDNGGIWNSMAYQLSRKGKEYRRRSVQFSHFLRKIAERPCRCNFRMKPHNKGDYVVMPASFPQPPEAPTYEPVAAHDVQMRPEDLDEVRALFNLLDIFVVDCCLAAALVVGVSYCVILCCAACLMFGSW